MGPTHPQRPRLVRLVEKSLIGLVDPRYRLAVSVKYQMKNPPMRWHPFLSEIDTKRESCIGSPKIQPRPCWGLLPPRIFAEEVHPQLVPSKL